MNVVLDYTYPNYKKWMVLFDVRIDSMVSLDNDDPYNIDRPDKLIISFSGFTNRNSNRKNFVIVIKNNIDAVDGEVMQSIYNIFVKNENNTEFIYLVEEIYNLIKEYNGEEDIKCGEFIFDIEKYINGNIYKEY
jgi:hypothetical protein